MSIRWENFVPQTMQRHAGSVKAPASKTIANNSCDSAVRPGESRDEELKAALPLSRN